MVITSLVKRVSREVHRRKRDYNDYQQPGTEDPTGKFILSDYHIVYYLSSLENNLLPPAMTTAENILKQLNPTNISIKSKRHLVVKNTTIYPEILLFADYGFNIELVTYYLLYYLFKFK